VNETFSSRLKALHSERRSVVCVGLDPDRLPAHLGTDPHAATREFCLEIITATKTTACAYKLNFAFFEALGPVGLDILSDVVAEARKHALTIADAKRGDIGNSASFYASSVFDSLGFDSVTVAPYMGRDSVEPFLQHEGTCAFILARTSNSGGDDFQPIPVNGKPLYEHVAESAARWAGPLPAEAGLVVGATDLDALARLRHILPNTPFLIPGVGAQGGEPRAVMHANGRGPVLVNSSRGIIYASSGRDFAAAAGRAARELADALEEARP
jgi:orotidine-5'-phosphate decarboxylase